MIALITLLSVLIIAYFMLYFGSRKYLETFEDRTVPSSATKASRPFPPAKPYTLQPIDRLDDYEMSMIFQNEGTKEASKKQISDAMSQYPLDWSTQGQNSQRFQEGQAAYEKTKAAKEPMRTQQDANEESMLLPDHVQQDEEEKKILQTYQPKCTKGLLEYCADDVKAIVDRVYGRKGLIPVVEKSSQGPNIWEIVEMKEKNPKIVWEDEDPAQERRDIMTSRGEEVITVPYPASDLAAGLDPFFQTGSSSRTGKHDYTKWTPGLERMYAPTYPIKSWF